MTGIYAAMGIGASGSLVSLQNASVSSAGSGATIRTAGWKIDADSYVYTLKQATYTQRYQWTNGAVADYQVRATLDSGTLTTGTAGSWLACSSDREWTVQAGSGASVFAYLTIEVRSASTLIVLASCTVQIIATGV